MAQIIKDLVTRPQILKDLVNERGLSQREIARQMGMKVMCLNYALRGKRAFGLHELIKFAQVMGVEWPTLLPAFGVADPTASDIPESADPNQFSERLYDLEVRTSEHRRVLGLIRMALEEI